MPTTGRSSASSNDAPGRDGNGGFRRGQKPGEAALLVAQLKALGLRGRDAGYLASAALPPPEAGPEQARYWDDLAFIVPAAKPAAVCGLLGLGAQQRSAA
jgi:hypothetical protein